MASFKVNVACPLERLQGQSHYTEVTIDSRLKNKSGLHGSCEDCHGTWTISLLEYRKGEAMDPSIRLTQSWTYGWCNKADRVFGYPIREENVQAQIPDGTLKRKEF